MTLISNPGGGFSDSGNAAGTIPMIGADGKLYSVPQSSLDIALKNNWKYAEAGKDTPEQPKEAPPEDLAAQETEKKIQAGVQEEEQHRVVGGLKRFGNEALLGIPQMISDYSADPEQRKINQEVRKRVEEAHPIETGLEKAGGFAASLLIPGIGEAGDIAKGAVLGGEAIAKTAAEGAVRSVAEASLGRKMAANAAKYATEGAIYSSPQAAVQIAYGDPEKAAETMLWGVGLSGVLGGGLTALGAGGKKVVEGVGDLSSKLLEKDSSGMSHLDQISRNILGITDKQANKLGPTKLTKIVQMADEEGLLSASEKKRPGMIDAMREDAGSKLGEHYQALDDAISNKKELQAKIPTGTEIASQFQKAIVEKQPELLSSLHSESLNFAKKIEEELIGLGNEPTINDIWELKKTISKTQRDYQAGSVKAETVRTIDKILSKNLEASAESIFHEGEEPGRFADYLKSKERFSTAAELSENLNPFKGKGKLPTSLSAAGFMSPMALATGHPVGAAALLAGKVVSQFMKNKGNGVIASYLRKAVADPASVPIIGGLMAKAGVEGLESHLNSIPDILSKGIIRTVNKFNPFEAMTGQSSTGLSKDKQYDKLVNAIQSTVSDPQGMAERVGTVASVFSGTNINLASLVAAKKMTAITYLNSQIPKNPNPPKPFQKDEYKPTEQQKRDFLQTVEIVSNPMVVWDHYQSGTLNKTDRNTLQGVYPQIYQSMVNKVMAAAYDPRNKPLTFAQRLQLSTFTGIPLDDSLKSLGALQQAVSTPVQPPGAGGPAGKPGAHQRERAPKFEHTPSLMTDSQRRTSKGK